MHTFHERSSDQERNHARKRARVDQEPITVNQQYQQSAPNDQPARPAASSTPSSSNQAMDPTAISFEAMVGLALKNSNWQELQSNVLTPAAALSDKSAQAGTANDVNATGSEVEMPKVITEKQKKKQESFNQTIARDAGDILQVIEMDTLSPISQNVTWDQDPELLCCYNWQASKDGTNTILVPGEPAKWHQPALPHTLERDSGYQYADYNYARQPGDPYSPMFHALSVMNPNYQFNDVDVLADRNNLRVLLECVQGKANGPFRLDLYLIFDTLIIVRKESRWWKHSDGASSGYGSNFEKFFTRPAEGMEHATSHYRAIRYPMGPLNVVCRFEADAYNDGLVCDDLTQSEATPVSGGLRERPRFNYRDPIRVLRRGHVVPTAQMVELKTQKHDPERFRPVACQDQLWFGRTSLLGTEAPPQTLFECLADIRIFTGPYELNTGVINHVRLEDATERIKNWEESNQESLRKLVTLLTQLKAVLRRERRPNHAVVLVREDKAGPLSVRTMEGKHHAVGREFFTKHWRQTPMQSAPQGGGYRGQRGGRGVYNAPPGRGQSYGSYGPSYAPHGRGQSYGSNVPAYAPHGRGQSYGSHVPTYAPRGRDQFYGGGFTEQGRRPDYRRGGP